MPRTIIYCRSIKDCGLLFRQFHKVLGDEGYMPGQEPSYETRYFAMYHHCTVDSIKDHVLSSLLNPAGIVRIVIATNALGMGVNIRDVRSVIHWGPSRDIEGYVQEIGRAGRDQLPSRAVLLYTSRHLGLAKELKPYMTTTDCRRIELLQHFPGTNTTDKHPSHTCCDNCQVKCKCNGHGGCDEVTDFPLNMSSDVPTRPTMMRSTSKEDLYILKDCLYELQDTYCSNNATSFCGLDLSHGLTDKLIDLVLEEAKYIFSAEHIIENLPVISMKVARDIAMAVSEVFDDFTMQDNVCTINADYQDILDHAYGYAFETDCENSSDSDN